MFGSDSTGGGIGFQFRQLKNDAKLQRDSVARGEDPKKLGIGSGGAKGGSSTFSFALNSLFTQHNTN